VITIAVIICTVLEITHCGVRKFAIKLLYIDLVTSMIVKCPHMYKGHITGSLQSTTYRSVSLFVVYFLVLVAI